MLLIGIWRTIFLWEQPEMFCCSNICSGWQGEGICYRLYDGRMLDSKTNYKEPCQKEWNLYMMEMNRIFRFHFGEVWDDSKPYWEIGCLERLILDTWDIGSLLQVYSEILMFFKGVFSGRWKSYWNNSLSNCKRKDTKIEINNPSNWFPHHLLSWCSIIISKTCMEIGMFLSTYAKIGFGFFNYCNHWNKATRVTRALWCHSSSE